jgi:hypothetical protein
VDVRSFARQIADEMNALSDGIAGVGPFGPGLSARPKILFRLGNIQVNDPNLDHIQIFPNTRPYLLVTQSETSIASHGRHVVAVYNTSAGTEFVEGPGGLPVLVRRFFSGYSVSADHGRTWASGFMPPLPGSINTLGDPVVDVDRQGNFYFSGLGTDSLGRFTVQVNKSTDGGISWSDAILVAQDSGGDKEWLAIGPDPVRRRQDNIYVTWTSFTSTGTQLKFARSVDGGVSWEARTIFAPLPNPDPNRPQNRLQFSNPVVDRRNGKLYVPFLNFSGSDQDFIRILVSDDGGENFSFINFNAPGESDPTLLPVVQPGELIDCGSGGLRLTVHAGPDIGGGRMGLRRFVQASRLTVQPAFDVYDDHLFLAWSNSNSMIFGDPSSGSNVLFIKSEDGGNSWSDPIQVNRATERNVHHLLPSLDIEGASGIYIGYYVQHQDESIDVQLAASADGGATFQTRRISKESSELAPTNIPLTGTATTNFDRVIAPCYFLGEYLDIRVAAVNAFEEDVFALWGDGRNLITEPEDSNNPISGETHAQADVFFQHVRIPRER